MEKDISKNTRRIIMLKAKGKRLSIEVDWKCDYFKKNILKKAAVKKILHKKHKNE